MENSCELAAFQRCFNFLQKGLQHELSTVVTALYSESLISSESRDQCLSRNEHSHERAAHLLSVLENRIFVDPTSFHSITRELDSCPTLQGLATKLRSELERIKGERSERERQQAEVDQAITTDEVHGASFSLTTSSQPASVPTALGVKQQIVFLEGQFASLVMQLVSMLTILESKSDDFVHKVRAAVLAIPLSLKKEHRSFLQYHRSTFKHASTVTEIVDALCSYWDYLNVSLFEHMMMMFGGDEVKAEFKTYLEHLQDFRQKTKLGDFIDALGVDRTALPPEFVEVQLRMGSSWDDRTLEDAEQLRLRQCRKAEIASYGLYFTGGRQHCIILTLGVAKMAVTSLLSVLDDTEQRECDIIDYSATAPVLDTLSTVEDTGLTEEEGPAVVPSSPSSPTPVQGATGGSDAAVIASGSNIVDVTDEQETHQKRSVLKNFFQGTFKKENRFARRKDTSTSILQKYPQKIPVIVERSIRDRDELPLLGRTKFLVPGEITMAQFVSIIRHATVVSHRKMFAMLVNNKWPDSMSITMSQLYQEHKDEDGFLYVVYSTVEEHFGGECIIL